jgi:cytoskeletal protein CcmA (bactofilin family)
LTGTVTGNVTGDVTGDLTGDVAGDVYAQNGTSVVLQNGTDGTDATFTGKLATARAIALTGDVTGTANFDGSADISITATVADDSHNHTIANIDGLQAALNTKTTQANAILGAHPVGSIYTSTIATNPANIFGGTWESFGAGKVLVGLDVDDTDFDTGEETGGAKTNTVDTTVTRDGWGSYQSYSGHLPEPTTDGRLVTGSGDTESGENLESLALAATNQTFTSTAAPIVQPYIVVYMFKRTA